MAVIKCPICKAEIAERAVQCAHCGYKLEKEPQCSKENEPTLSDAAGAYPNHSGTAGKQPEAGAKKKNRIFRYVMIIVILVILGFVGYEVHEYNQLKAYYQLVDEINDVRNAGVDALNHCSSLLLDVWHNAIFYEADPATDPYTCPEGVFEDDFNDALENLYSDDAFCKELELIDETQMELRKLKKQLTKAPKGYEEYNAYLIQMIDNWVELSTVIQHPSGSYNDLNEELSELFRMDGEILQEMELYDE